MRSRHQGHTDFLGATNRLADQPGARRARPTLSRSRRQGVAQLDGGYDVAIGDGDIQDGRDDTARLVRIYWHLTAAGAIPFIGAVSSTPNTLGIPFRAKVLSDPVAYQRADAGVLYLDQRDYEATRQTVQQFRAMNGHQFPDRHRVIAAPILAGLHHEGPSEAICGLNRGKVNAACIIAEHRCKVPGFKKARADRGSFWRPRSARVGDQLPQEYLNKRLCETWVSSVTCGCSKTSTL